MYGVLFVCSAVVLIGLIVAIVFATPTARLRRRLKKTHSRIISKSERPSVKFSVKTPKK
ncbi:MAG TPA: hypothetical protein VFD66_12695 [Verrucomicrobiae bacterium]|nr:hypothetical protein [Verrucomicrobiae bacterium]